MSTARASVIVIQPSVDYAQRILEAGETAVFVVEPKRAKDFKEFDNAVCVETLTLASVAAELQKHARRRAVAYIGVACFVCEYLPLAAELSRAMGFDFPSTTVVQRARNKDLAHVIWTNAGVATPACRLLRDAGDLAGFVSEQPPPWVLKPANGTGSAWVTRVERHEDLALAYSSISDGLAVAQEGMQQSCLVQALVRGRELSADFYLDGEIFYVLRATEKLMSGRLGEVIAYYPAVLTEQQKDAVCALLKAAAQALGMARGHANADIILTASGPLILEMAIRPGGDCLPDLCKAAHGYDPIKEACRVARGRAPRADQPWLQHIAFAAVHLLSDQSGIVEYLSFDNLAADPDVLSYEAYVGVGDVIDANSACYEDRIVGACLMRVDSLDHLTRRAPTLVNKLDLKTRATPRAAGAAL